MGGGVSAGAGDDERLKGPRSAAEAAADGGVVAVSASGTADEDAASSAPKRERNGRLRRRLDRPEGYGSSVENGERRRVVVSSFCYESNRDYSLVSL